MKFKLVEAGTHLNESYDIKQSARNAVSSLVKYWTTQPATTRGNGVLCEALCSLVNIKTGLSLIPSDYIVHHLDGDHKNNSITNLVLLKCGGQYSHRAVHNGAIDAAISDFFYHNYKLPTNTLIDATTISGLSLWEELYIVCNYIRFIDMGTTRKSNNASSSDEIILIRNVI